MNYIIISVMLEYYSGLIDALQLCVFCKPHAVARMKRREIKVSPGITKRLAEHAGSRGSDGERVEAVRLWKWK